MKNLFFFCFLVLSFCSFSQEQQPDTLFIRYDAKLLSKHTASVGRYQYYLIEGTGTSGTISLREIGLYKKLKPKKIVSLSSIFKASKAYLKDGSLSDPILANYLSTYVVFLVKKRKYIKVDPRLIVL